VLVINIQDVDELTNIIMDTIQMILTRTMNSILGYIKK
jgi:hypothetical protein